MPTKFDASYTAYQTDRGRLRKLVRSFYLRKACSELVGPTLDFGCGIGELLSMLPAGSQGLEYNPATVSYCRERGLDVTWYDGMADDWSLTSVAPDRRFESMVISHVLEHLDEPIRVLARLLEAARRLGIERILVVVPGKAGYRLDDTHRTFVTRDMLVGKAALDGNGFHVARVHHFPGDLRALGDWFPHHELHVIYDVGEQLEARDTPT